MTKEFTPYKQALALKELGFDKSVFKVFPNTKTFEAPLYQQAFNWFREKYQLHSTITSVSQESWQWHITSPGESLGVNFDEDFYTYEEAQLACLKELIKIAKKKK